MASDDGYTSASEPPRRSRRPARIGVARTTVQQVTGPDRFHRTFQAMILPQNDYRYTPLADGQIRLLRLQEATQRSNEIYCFLETVTLDDPSRPPYDALSYTWGVGEATQVVKVQTAGNSSLRTVPSNEAVQNGDASSANAPRSRVQNRLGRVLPSSSKNFPVTYNLEQALRRFREPHETLVLWVDAICINQNDLDEKGKQVAKMAEIYGQADGVRIWLGEESDDSKVAVEHVRSIMDLQLLDNLVSGDEASPAKWYALAQLMRREWFSRQWVVQELAMAREAFVYIGQDELHWDDFAEAVSLFARESDKVAQLLRNSREFRYSSSALGDIRSTGASSIVETANNLFRTSDGRRRERLTGLEALVASLLTFETADPRDIIYALLAIAKDIDVPTSMISSQVLQRCRTNAIAFEADYTKTTLEVYKDFVAFCIKSSGSLDILCRHWAPNKFRRKFTPQERLQAIPPRPPHIEFELPSWIGLLERSSFGLPETAAQGHRVAADGLVGPPGQKRYDAARGTTPSVWFGEVDVAGANSFDRTKPLLSQNQIPSWTPANHRVSIEETLQGNNQGFRRRSDGCLYATGFILDTIEQISYRMKEGEIQRETLSLGGWTGDNNNDPAALPDYLWRTLVADRGQDGGNPPIWYRRAMLHCINSRDAIGDIYPARLSTQETSSAMLEFLQRMSNVIWNRILVKSSDGQFGHAPTDTQTDDVICILLGCSVPVILRPVLEVASDSEHQELEISYQFIGEAYVYGMMDGEFLTQPHYAGFDSAELSEHRDARVFRLR